MPLFFSLYSVLSQFTRLTDGQTDTRTAFSSLDRVCIACSVVHVKTTDTAENARGVYEQNIIKYELRLN